MARIIDKEGAEFGATIERKSKVMQERNQLNPEQTSSLMTSTRTPEYVWRQSRTAFKDNLGFSPISSQRKVCRYVQEKSYGREKRGLGLYEEKYLS